MGIQKLGILLLCHTLSTFLGMLEAFEHLPVVCVDEIDAKILDLFNGERSTD
jgi:hypothetical protein